MALSSEYFLVVLLFAVVIAVAWIVSLLTERLKNREAELEQLKSQIIDWNSHVEKKVVDRTHMLHETHKQMEATCVQVVTSLVEASTAKYYYLSTHAHNVAVYAKAIARELSFPPAQMEALIQGCKLHDLGKIGVPDAILRKTDPLTAEEIEIVKQHPIWGARILEPIASLKKVTQMVLQEHERWDGRGYPQGLKGEGILLEARIISVADALDAMISDRPYRDPISIELACDELKRSSGTQFDPKVIDACVKAVKEKNLIAATGHHQSAMQKPAKPQGNSLDQR